MAFYLQVVMEGHIIAGFLQHFKLRSLADVPDSSMLQKLTVSKDQASVFHKMITEMLSEHIKLPIAPESKSSQSEDGILAYAQEILSLSLLWAEFQDAIREGDGLRVVRCWRFLLLVFKAAQRKNYSCEAVTLLVQYHALLSPRQKEQLVWSRFINTKGKVGANKSCDLHMEHLNGVVKTALGNESSNLKPPTISRVGKCAGPLMSVSDQFDDTSSVKNLSGKHAKASWDKDLERITEQIHGLHVFQRLPGQKHNSFPSVRGSIVSKMDKTKFQSWFKKQLKELNS